MRTSTVGLACLSLLGVLAAGCASSPPPKPTYVQYVPGEGDVPAPESAPVIPGKAPKKEETVFISLANARVGMPESEARAKFGEPDKINRTVTEGGTHEQWVYSAAHVYLYFDNGLLKSWQE